MLVTQGGKTMSCSYKADKAAHLGNLKPSIDP